MNQRPLPGMDAPPPPGSKLSATRRLTARSREMIARGIHPMTRKPLLTTGERCGDCSHLLGASYFKCDLMPITHGPATDVRKRWPACTLFAMLT